MLTTSRYFGVFVQTSSKPANSPACLLLTTSPQHLWGNCFFRVGLGSRISLGFCTKTAFLCHSWERSLIRGLQYKQLRVWDWLWIWPSLADWLPCRRTQRLLYYPCHPVPQIDKRDLFSCPLLALEVAWIVAAFKDQILLIAVPCLSVMCQIWTGTLPWQPGSLPWPDLTCIKLLIGEQ